MDRQIDREIGIQTDKKIGRLMIDSQIDRQIDTETDRQVDKMLDKQIRR